jgi:hypothetical protein
MKLLDVEFRPLAGTAPNNGTAFLVDFHHMTPGFFPGVTKDQAEHMCDITHKIHGVIVDDNIPRQIQEG